MNQLISKVVCLAFVLGITVDLNAQVYTNKEVGKKHEAEIDSLKKSEYPYSLPIMGAKATSKGYKLPYSAGVSSQYFWQKSDIIIDNLQVGFNNGEMYGLDEVIKFDKAVASVGAITVRPDIWLFPFLNVYGIFGYGAASTDVGFGVWVPDSNNVPTEILSSGALVEFNSPSVGFGLTPTFGVAGLFVVLDMNFSWVDVPQLKDPAKAFVFGPRVGKTFKFKKEDMAISTWVGGFRVNISSGTSGSINMADVFNSDELNGKIDQGYEKLDAAQQNLEEWWTGLTPLEQAKPSNKAKYEAANSAMDKAGQILVSAENAVNGLETSTVQYSMDKRPADKWNFIIGTQYQLNRHWMARVEVGFLASRSQATAGIQYRFGL